MKKLRYSALAAVLAAAVFTAGCGQSSGTADGSAGNAADKISIVCTVFPEYDWVKQILGDNAGNADITYLLQNGVDLHNFQPIAEDIIKISSCDLFLYVGGESDEWAADALVLPPLAPSRFPFSTFSLHS